MITFVASYSDLLASSGFDDIRHPPCLSISSAALGVADATVISFRSRSQSALDIGLYGAGASRRHAVKMRDY